MKKLIASFVLAVISISAISAVFAVSAIPAVSDASVSAGHIAYAANKPIKTVEVLNGNTPGTATLSGSGENFITDLKVTVKFDGSAPYEIKLEDGYSPSIDAFDFGAEAEFLFCSSQTGGSGGYGNYRVYHLKTASYELLYDDKLNSARTTFSAEFQPNGFMTAMDNSSEHALTVYVGYMDPAYYKKIFNNDGSLTGEQPYVNDISFVSPALNPASGVYRLLTYRSVVAIAEVNRLGYIVQTLGFDGAKFTAYSTDFAINI